MPFDWSLVGIGLAAALALPAMAQESAHVVPLGDFYGLRTVRATVAGHTGDFILDTGGGVTVVSPGLAEAAGCAPWGQVTGFRLTGERLTMPRCDDLTFSAGEVALTAPTAGVFDLAALLPPEAPRIEGLVALDSLANRPFTLELRDGRLTMETPASLSARIEGGVEVPIRLHRQAGGASLTVMVRVPTDKGPLWMQLDCGSDAPMLIAKTSAEPLGLDPQREGRQPLQLHLAGVSGEAVEADVEADVRDMIIDGNIGLPVMRNWVMTFDLKAERLWIRPAS